MSTRHPEFEVSLEEAKRYPQIWRLLLGILLILFIYLSGTIYIILGAVGVSIADVDSPFGMIGAATTTLQEFGLGQKPWTIALLLLTFLGMALGPIIAAAALHFRGPGSLFGEFEVWKRGFGVALGATAVILGGMTGLSFWLLDAPTPNLPLTTWALWMPLAIPLLMIQIGAEELLFRGYLQQQLAARFTSRVVWMWLPSVIFALLHWSPEAGDNLPLILLSTLTFGLVAADLTERTGSLGAAMGIHFANNFLALFVVVVGPSMTGLALYVSPLVMGEAGITSLGLTLHIFATLAVWAVVKHLLDA